MYKVYLLHPKLFYLPKFDLYFTLYLFFSFRIGFYPTAAATDKSWWSRFFHGSNNSGSGGSSSGGGHLASQTNPTWMISCTRRHQGQHAFHRRHRQIVQKLMEETSRSDSNVQSTASDAEGSKASDQGTRQESGTHTPTYSPLSSFSFPIPLNRFITRFPFIHSSFASCVLPVLFFL